MPSDELRARLASGELGETKRKIVQLVLDNRDSAAVEREESRRDVEADALVASNALAREANDIALASKAVAEDANRIALASKSVADAARQSAICANAIAAIAAVAAIVAAIAAWVKGSP